MPSAFSYSACHPIRANIRVLFHRVKAVCKIPMTHEEFSSLFIPADQREMFLEMSRLAHCASTSGVDFTWGATKLRFRMVTTEHKKALLIPRDITLQDDAPPELIERITTWTTNGGDASGEFGRVAAVFELLNSTLTKGQLRFVWPSILTILAEGVELSATLKELQDVKVPTDAPELPRGLLAACRRTAATIATSSLIPPDAAVETTEGSVEVVDGQKYEELGLGEYVGLS